MKTDKKIQLREIKPIEEHVAQHPDPDSQVVKAYASALRSVLLEDGRPPLDLPGVNIYDRLEDISHNLCNPWPIRQPKRTPNEPHQKVRSVYALICTIARAAIAG